MNNLTMKALSIQQPWANMIASGQKTIETRTWATSYRGDLLICSSKTPRIYPAGAALAIAELVDCRPMTFEDRIAACCRYHDGLFAWVLANIRKIGAFPVKGKLRLFEVELPEGLTTTCTLDELLSEIKKGVKP
ncbi:ASCH domain-containing protein [Candidatus Pacearchaeota archaeon]|jgi:hypothetical protein|nr:ASCH domain-containing protein [Candidatus Pacearchaeota archaeon]